MKKGRKRPLCHVATQKQIEAEDRLKELFRDPKTIDRLMERADKFFGLDWKGS